MADAELESAEDTCAAVDDEENPHRPPMELHSFRDHGEAHWTSLCNQANDKRHDEQKEKGYGGLEQEQDRKVEPHAMWVRVPQNESRRLPEKGEDGQTPQIDPGWHEQSAQEKGRHVVSKQSQRVGWLVP